MRKKTRKKFWESIRLRTRGPTGKILWVVHQHTYSLKSQVLSLYQTQRNYWKRRRNKYQRAYLRPRTRADSKCLTLPEFSKLSLSNNSRMSVWKIIKSAQTNKTSSDNHTRRKRKLQDWKTLPNRECFSKLMIWSEQTLLWIISKIVASLDINFPH